MISALLVATHIINFQGNLRKFVKDLSGPTHPTTQYSGLLDCFPRAYTTFLLIISQNNCVQGGLKLGPPESRTPNPESLPSHIANHKGHYIILSQNQIYLIAPALHELKLENIIL